MKTTAITLETIRSNYPKLSLKRIAETTGVCYQYALKASKKPIPNQPYDPSAFNYAEVEKIFERKSINLADYDWSAIEAEIATIVPISKIEEFAVGVEFTLREANEDKVGIVYTVVYTTETHIVFQAVSSTQPRVMNYDTFMHQSPRIIA